MTANFHEVLAAAKSLTNDEQQELIDELMEAPPETIELSDEWKAEIDRRWQALKDGTAKLYTWEEVEAELIAREKNRGSN